MTSKRRNTGMRGNRNAARLFDDEIKKIRQMHASGNWSCLELAIGYNVDRKTIWRCVKRITYRTVA